MKKLMVFTAAIMIFAGNAFAQEQTLLGDDKIISGGFGGPVIKVSTLNDKTALMVGGKGGWIINHKFSIGGGGYGQVLNISAPKEAIAEYPYPNGTARDLNIEFGYGGFIMEYIGGWDKIVHYSVTSLIGAGGISYYDEIYDDDDDYDDDWDSRHFNLDDDAFFVFEPGINAEMNITKWFRVNAGVSYLLVQGVDLVGLDDSDVGGLTGTLTFKFGKF